MSWTCLRSKEVRGRKQYTCCLCGLRIRKGAKHLAVCGVYDGEFVSDRRHAVCSAATRHWDDLDWDTFDDQAAFREFELGIKAVRPANTGK